MADSKPRTRRRRKEAPAPEQESGGAANEILDDSGQVESAPVKAGRRRRRKVAPETAKQDEDAEEPATTIPEANEGAPEPVENMEESKGIPKQEDMSGERNDDTGNEHDDDLQLILDWGEALDKARQYRARKQPRVPAKQGEGYQGKDGEQFSLCVPRTSEDRPCLADLGVGVALYFDMLVTFGTVLFVVFLLSSPSFILTFIINPDAASDAMVTGGPLGALKVLTIGGMFKSDPLSEEGCNATKCVFVSGQELDATDVAYIVAYADLFACVVFLCGVLWLRKRIFAITGQADGANVTAGDYSVLVRGLPEDISPDQVRDFFQRYDGTVCPAPEGPASPDLEGGGGAEEGGERRGEQEAVGMLVSGWMENVGLFFMGAPGEKSEPSAEEGAQRGDAEGGGGGGERGEEAAEGEGEGAVGGGNFGERRYSSSMGSEESDVCRWRDDDGEEGRWKGGVWVAGGNMGGGGEGEEEEEEAGAQARRRRRRNRGAGGEGGEGGGEGAGGEGEAVKRRGALPPLKGIVEKKKRRRKKPKEDAAAGKTDESTEDPAGLDASAEEPRGNDTSAEEPRPGDASIEVSQEPAPAQLLDDEPAHSGPAGDPGPRPPAGASGAQEEKTGPRQGKESGPGPAGGRDMGPFSGVADVVLARRDAGLLGLMRRRARYIEEEAAHRHALETEEGDRSETLQFVLKQNAEAMRRVELAIELERAREGGQVVGAFVVFNSAVARNDCLRHFGKRGAGLCKAPHDDTLLEGKPLHVLEAPEPADVVWENLEVRTSTRWLLSVVAALISFLVVLVSFVVMVAGKSYQTSMARSGDVCAMPAVVSACNQNLAWDAVSDVGCAQGVGACSLADVWSASLASQANTPLDLDEIGSPAKVWMLSGDECRFDNDTRTYVEPSMLSGACRSAAEVTSSQWTALVQAGFRDEDAFTIAVGDAEYDGRAQCMKCMCAALMEQRAGLWSDSWGTGSIKDAQGRLPCGDQAQSYFFFIFLQAAALVVIFLVNVFMVSVTKMMARFERQTTKSAESAAVAQAVFVCQFINTSFVTLLVYAQIAPLYDALEGEAGDSNIFRLFPIFAGPYADFNFAWYGVVGVSIMVAAILNLFLPTLPLLFGWLASQCTFCCVSKKMTQKSLNRAYLGPEFEVGSRYGTFLNVIFTCMMFSSGMPILLLVASLFSFVTCWVDKAFLLRIASTPQMHSNKIPPRWPRLFASACCSHAELALSTSRLLKFAVILHLAIASWVFTSTYEDSGLLMFPREWLASNWAAEDRSRLYDFMRVFSTVSFGHFVLLALLVLYVALNNTVLGGGVSRRVNAMLAHSSAEAEAAEEGKLPSYMHALRTKAFHSFPSSYDLCLIGEYKDFLSIKDQAAVFRSVSPYTSQLPGGGVQA